jgi:Ca2+-binding RTX toxin-like protein
LLGVLPQQAVAKLTLPKPIDIDGRLFAQAVVGTVRSDRISGSSDDEILAGGLGRDRLRGAAGTDAFLFEVAEFGKRGADIITDFNRRQGDQIAISREAFAGLNQVKLTSVAGKRALKEGATSGNPFIYDASKGRLYYDANGSKPGLGDGGLFAILQGAPALRAGDLALV